VGIEVQPSGDGALRFVQWLHARAPEGHAFRGLHVADTAAFDVLERLAGRSESRDRLFGEVRRVLAATGLEIDAEVSEMSDPVFGLEGTADLHRAGVIVGRRTRAAAGGEGLGAVTRRLLRRLAAPTLVVPSELDADALGDGPLILAFAPDEASEGAARLAGRLAETLERPLVAVHVGDGDVPDLGAWLRAQGLGGEAVLRTGDKREAILGLARQLAAPLVVCGSRRLGPVGRVFAGSLSGELSGHAEVPVLVVPPDAAVE
jgi:nucleotide-binding universal stress UspA family protein